MRRLSEMKDLSERKATGIAGSSEAIRDIRNLVFDYSIEEEPVFLIGETGVGKSHIAELIHRFSGRNGEFVVIHTPSIPEDAFDDVVFGFPKDPLTDEDREKKGMVSLAEGGTIFFEEITEVPISFQAKLLNFIDTKEYHIHGNIKEIRADVRIISGSSQDLNKEIEAKRFREDLYFRLSVLPIEIPPLRDRKGDIKDIIMENKRFLKGKKVNSEFWEIILSYDWPGNVRELIHVIKRAGVHLKGPVIGKEVADMIQPCLINKKSKMNESIDKIWYLLESGESFWDVVKKPFLNRELNRFEVKSIISKGLNQSNGKYKNCLKIFNIDSKEYKNFMRFLYDNQLK